MTPEEDGALRARLNTVAAEIEGALDALLPAEDEGAERPLLSAMRYAAMGGGKRLRGFLVVETASLFDVDRARALRVAAALECIHAYSLVHDDLPAMDDDDLRRGKPTVHKAYDEATAILAGDALQTLAFEILADEATHEDPFVRCRLIARLADASGAAGMAGGQMIDLAAERADAPFDIGAITRLQRMKTGALIAASCACGAILGHASADAARALEGYAHDLGLAFQIRDDLLDVEGDEVEIGKKIGKDADAGKATFVSILGVDGAKERADMLVAQATRHLAPFGDGADALALAAKFSISRRS